MRVTAATMAAASSSVGTGEIDAMEVFIDEPPLNAQPCRAMFASEDPRSSIGIQRTMQAQKPNSSGCALQHDPYQ
jgi:hypothetical protein